MKATREIDIVGQCLKWLKLHGHFAWRQNCGAMRIADRFVRFNGAKGCSDIIGLLRPSGRFLAVEVKRPGEVPTVKQSLFLESVRAVGGLACCVSSIDDLEFAITSAS